MQNNNDLIQRILEQNTQLAEEDRRLRDRLDIALNTISFQHEEIQRLKDEIAILKGQKPRPKIPPSTLEGQQSKDKQNDKNKLSRGMHPRRKKTKKLEIHTRSRIKPESVPEELPSKDVRNLPYRTSFFSLTIPYTNSSDGNCLMALT